MKNLIVLFSIVGIFLGCQLRVSESNIKADNYADNKRIKKVLTTGLARILDNYPTEQIRGFLKEGPLSMRYCRHIAIAQGLLEGLEYTLIFMADPENKLFSYNSDFYKELSKMRLEYHSISSNCSEELKDHTEISQQLEASRVKLKVLYAFVKDDSDKLREDSTKKTSE